MDLFGLNYVWLTVYIENMYRNDSPSAQLVYAQLLRNVVRALGGSMSVHIFNVIHNVIQMPYECHPKYHTNKYIMTSYTFDGFLVLYPVRNSYDFASFPEPILVRF